MGSPHRTHASTVDVRARADLGNWAARKWTDGVQLEDLPPLEQLVVRTRNSTYAMTILSPNTGEVLVCGGRFFPEPTRVRVAGASLGGSFLKIRGIYVGFAIELRHDGETVITSAVRSIGAAEPASVQ
jgi:hypothetical protein